MLFAADETLAISQTEFLTDIANQNYCKFGVPNPLYELKTADDVGGQMYLVGPIDRIKMATAVITDAFFKAPYLNTNVIVHKPFYDATIDGK